MAFSSSSSSLIATWTFLLGCLRSTLKLNISKMFSISSEKHNHPSNCASQTLGSCPWKFLNPLLPHQIQLVTSFNRCFNYFCSDL